jgi:hypothetical protein
LKLIETFTIKPDVISDTVGSQKEILKCIDKFGHLPEHNYFYYEYMRDKETENRFLKFGNEGLLANFDPRGEVWEFITEPLAEQSNKLNVLLQAISYCFSEGAEKVKVELSTDFKKQLINNLPTELRACRDSEVLIWPVFDMATWDGTELSGNKWKKLRHAKNSMEANGKVEVVPCTEIKKEKLKALVEEWKRNRTPNDRANEEYYVKLVENDFLGMDSTRSVLVDGEPCSITGGWKIPNSNDYYSETGLHNYKYEALGDYANWDDLVELKKRGFRKVDFGGSDKKLFAFKKKLNPTHTYKTHIFSIVRKSL